jgi:GT2 family glycosyltransferase
MGCEAASGTVLVFVSGHCIPSNQDWLDKLIEPVAEGAATYVYGRQVGGEDTQYSEHQIFEKYFPKDAANAQGGYFCNNANSAILRDVWERFRFDEELTGLEDMELAKRLFDAGHAIAYAPEATVSHLHEETWRQVRTRYEREAIALQKIAPEIRVGFADFLRYTISAVSFDLVAAAREGALLRNAGSIMKFRVMQYLGTYRGNQVQRALSRRAMERYFYPRTGGNGQNKEQ